MSDQKKPHLVVLGGGPGGYAAAFRAADLGLSVTLVDPEENPGGVCLHRGCIPSKALLHVAALIQESREAANWGLHFAEPEVKLDELRDWVASVVGRLTGGLGQLSKQRGVEHIRGVGRFEDSGTIRVEGVEGEADRTLHFDHCIVATGSLPVDIPGLERDGERIIGSREALRTPDLPSSLLVVGGGYIGLELGTVYAALGSEVTVVEMTDSLLPGVDPDLVKILSRRVRRDFEDVLLETKVAEAKVQKNGVKVSFEGKKGADARKLYDKVLVSVGRRPRSEDIGLEAAGIETDERGFIPVDEQRRTSVEGIWAIGDVAGEPMLAHAASHEGIVAAEVIAGEEAAAYEPRAVPAVVFTDPEIAWTGRSRKDAEEEGLEVESYTFPWAASGRAVTLGRTDGLTKLIVEKQSKRLLGVGLVGPGAGELIAEATHAVEMGAHAQDLALTIHPHPTLSETLMEAAQQVYGPSTHYLARKR